MTHVEWGSIRAPRSTPYGGATRRCVPLPWTSALVGTSWPNANCRTGRRMATAPVIDSRGRVRLRATSTVQSRGFVRGVETVVPFGACAVRCTRGRAGRGVVTRVHIITIHGTRQNDI